MQSASRRAERRQDVIEAVVKASGFKLSRLLDLTHYEAQGKFLEGTGSLVLDHIERVAYACASARTHPEVVSGLGARARLRAGDFSGRGRGAACRSITPMSSCASARARSSSAARRSPPADRERVLARLAASGREIIEIGPGRHRTVRRQHARARELGRGARRLPRARDVANARGARSSPKPSRSSPGARMPCSRFRCLPSKQWAAAACAA